MDSSKFRIRFAPSPTGPLHIGGVRTALYNYLFAKKTGGKFIIRIEDTDQNRYVEGAEDYIMSSLKWLGLFPDEGPGIGGDYGPYRQSERKHLYAQYAEELVSKGHAYYAFDSAEDLDKMRTEQETLGNHSAKYDSNTRVSMKNSLTVSGKELADLIQNSENKVIRLKIPNDETIVFSDMVRDEVSFQSNLLDDKVILKGDGMPTYHLANIIDDHLMEITHVIRGEEWLSSTAHHILLYRFFGWEAPVFTHLPLLLKPTGKGKLSKRDGAKFGFPVFPMAWNEGEETYAGFKEDGYDPDALLNFLVLLGWHPADDQEIMNLDQMAAAFSLEAIVKSGARFDIDKALWFNQQYIMSYENSVILYRMSSFLPESITNNFDEAYLLSVIELMKQRIQKYSDFVGEALFFFKSPDAYDEKQVRKRYNDELATELKLIRSKLSMLEEFTAENLSDTVKGYLSDNSLKMGAYLPVIRIIMCGAMTGPDLFEIMKVLGKEEVLRRWDVALNNFSSYLS